MDTSSLLLGLLFLGIFILPIVYIEFKKKKSSKDIAIKFQKLAETNQLQLDHTDFIRAKCFGLDSKKHQFLFIDFNEKEAKPVLLKLHDYQSVISHEVTRKIDAKEGSSTLTERIELQFKAKVGKAVDTKVTLFSTNEAFMMMGEIALSNKWVQLLKHHL